VWYYYVDTRPHTCLRGNATDGHCLRCGLLRHCSGCRNLRIIDVRWELYCGSWCLLRRRFHFDRGHQLPRRVLLFRRLGTAARVHVWRGSLLRCRILVFDWGAVPHRVLVQQHVELDGLRRRELLPYRFHGAFSVRRRVLWRVDDPSLRHLNMQRRMYAHAWRLLPPRVKQQRGYAMPDRVLLHVDVVGNALQHGRHVVPRRHVC
jgi:hypothetical protein